MKREIQVNSILPATTNNGIVNVPLSQFTISLPVASELLIPIKSYIYHFPKYCSSIEKKIVSISIKENFEELELTFISEESISYIETIFKKYLNLVQSSNLYLSLKKRCKKIDDTEAFHKLCIRLEEEIRHINRVLYLELGLKRILTLPEGSINTSIYNKTQIAFENKIQDYADLVRYIETSKENEYLVKENTRLQEELKRIESERKEMLNKLLKIVDEKFGILEKATNNMLDKTQVKGLIVHDKFEEVFDLLNLITHKGIRVEVIILENRWRDNEKRYRLDIENIETYRTEKNKIIYSLIQLVDDF
jgi:Effector-associated domain 11